MVEELAKQEASEKQAASRATNSVILEFHYLTVILSPDFHKLLSVQLKLLELVYTGF
jgi:hypothetical protein